MADATVNDAVLSVIGGALRSYLQSKQELPEDSMLAMAPVSVRSDTEKGDQGNQVAGMTVTLGTHLADPVERLRAVHDSSKASKAITNAIGARLMTDYTEFIPSATAALAARQYSELALANRTNPSFNCVVTNVPGPQVPLYLGGARLVAQYGLGPIQDGMGLIHGVFSYCGQVMVSWTSCRDMMPDPGTYAEHVRESYDELLRATARKPSPKPARKPRATARS